MRTTVKAGRHPLAMRCLALAACGFLGLPAVAQITGLEAPTRPSEQAKPEGKPIQVNVQLALVNVSVTDPYDRLVTGLEKDNFHVFEDGVPQEIVNFSSEDVPISIGIVLDMSGSMSD